MIHMEYYLVVSTIMMFAGIYGFFTRRNTLAILISVELILTYLSLSGDHDTTDDTSQQ